jgi:hypothetical protein
MVVQQISVDTCPHHWMIQPADGPVSLGVYQLIYDPKQFKNSIDDWSFERLPSERQSFDTNLLERQSDLGVGKPTRNRPHRRPQPIGTGQVPREPIGCSIFKGFRCVYQASPPGTRRRFDKPVERCEPCPFVRRLNKRVRAS